MTATRKSSWSKLVFALAFLLLQVRTQAQTITRDELLGRFDPARHAAFVTIDAKHADRPGLLLRDTVYDAFLRMREAAERDGIRLFIISAARNFDYQKSIWVRKWSASKYAGWTDQRKAKDILSYSSMPGTSRHHWGTDMDINSVESAYWKSAPGKKTHDWLAANAHRFGFCQTYTPKSGGRTGYEEEPWHWSFFPLSGPYLQAYRQLVTYEDITGFPGSDVARELQVLEDYVNGVECTGF
ncbi:MAG: M15 family metallopeptidase [Flavobacteriales bacterium]